MYVMAHRFHTTLLFLLADTHIEPCHPPPHTFLGYNPRPHKSSVQYLNTNGITVTPMYSKAAFPQFSERHLWKHSIMQGNHLVLYCAHVVDSTHKLNTNVYMRHSSAMHVLYDLALTTVHKCTLIRKVLCNN